MNLTDKKIWILTLVFLWAGSFWGCGSKEEFISVLPSGEPAKTQTAAETVSAPPETESVAASGAPEQGETIFVHVCGAVNASGVYELPARSRVFEALEMAGGCREEAAQQYLNLAQTLTDGQQVYVPSQEEIASGKLPDGGSFDSAGSLQDTGDRQRVNINTADREELMTLPGIGSAKADSIIRYRQEHGGFGSPEEIMEISGIKESVYEKIKDVIII